VRVLGVEKFGLLSFATATIAYFQILTDYGFNLSATREVAINRDNKEKLNEIFNSVMIIKFCLLIISFLLLSVLVFSFEKFRQDWLVYYLSFGMVLGQVLFPVWFFQGMERMRYITILNVVAKGIFTIAIFVYVKSQSDYWKVPLLNSIGFLIAGIASLILIYKYFNIVAKKVSKTALLRQLQDGWHIFIANLTGNIYGQGTIFILGLLKTSETVGYYSIGEKILKAISSLVQPIAQAIFPYLANKKKNELNKLFKTNFRKIIIFNTLFVLSLIIFFNLYVKKHILDSILISYYVMFIVLFFTILNVIKQPLIYVLKRDKDNSNMYIFVGLSFIPICFLFTYIFSTLGTALSLLYVEVVVFIIGMKIIINNI